MLTASPKLLAQTPATDASELVILVTSGLRRSDVKAAAWLRSSRVSKLFLNLPQDFEPFVEAYVENSIGERQLWKGFEYLTGLRGPHTRAVSSWFAPILEALPKVRDENPELEIACYLDLEYYLRADKIAEELLLLEYRERGRRSLKLDEWRRLLRKELDCYSQMMRSSIQNVLERLSEWSVMVYGGSIGALRELKERADVQIRPTYLDRYWRPPLQALHALALLRGFDNLSNEDIEPFVRDHLRYLDLLVTSQDLDGAHESWSLMHCPFRLGGFGNMVDELRQGLESA